MCDVIEKHVLLKKYLQMDQIWINHNKPKLKKPSME